ncbi:RnfH family protein [Celerinatantimonas yamalensis]|uniref:UPF0125 protein ABUE30_04330 n=1 Tax=Celerinatantimonas yamalensis TaxID=559956 RepID=A0ABW9G4Z0_9GAMM
MKISVAHAAGRCGKWIEIEVNEPVTIRQALEQSTLLTDFPTLDIGHCKVGLFGKIASLDTPVSAGARVEIYRPLAINPRMTDDDDDEYED